MNDAEKECYFLIFQIRRKEQELEKLQCELVDLKMELELKKEEL